MIRAGPNRGVTFLVDDSDLRGVTVFGCDPARDADMLAQAIAHDPELASRWCDHHRVLVGAEEGPELDLDRGPLRLPSRALVLGDEEARRRAEVMDAAKEDREPRQRVRRRDLCPGGPGVGAAQDALAAAVDERGSLYLAPRATRYNGRIPLARVGGGQNDQPPLKITTSAIRAGGIV